MKDLLVSMFGSYEPVLDPITGSVAPGLAGVDYVWVMSVFLFAIALYSLFRIIGSLIKG